VGIDKTILPPVPKYEETLPTIYTSDEILGGHPKAAIRYHLKTGHRE
jgi:hypothetical protein